MYCMVVIMGGTGGTVICTLPTPLFYLSPFISFLVSIVLPSCPPSCTFLYLFPYAPFPNLLSLLSVILVLSSSQPCHISVPFYCSFLSQTLSPYCHHSCTIFFFLTNSLSCPHTSLHTVWPFPSLHFSL